MIFLTVSPPLVLGNTSRRYFPLKRAANDSQYILGRAFLQEAYITVDYERGRFNVSQALWNDNFPADVRTIPSVASAGGVSDSSSTNTPSDSNSGPSGLSTGAIAGIAVAGVAFVVILLALFFLLGRNRVYKKWMSSEDGRNERTAHWALFNSQNGGTEAASNAGKPPMTDTTSVSSPDPNRFNTMSPPPFGDGNSTVGPGSPRQTSGHWSWDPSYNPRHNHGPSELEAGNIIHQLPESSNER